MNVVKRWTTQKLTHASDSSEDRMKSLNHEEKQVNRRNLRPAFHPDQQGERVMDEQDQVEEQAVMPCFYCGKATRQIAIINIGKQQQTVKICRRCQAERSQETIYAQDVAPTPSSEESSTARPPTPETKNADEKVMSGIGENRVTETETTLGMRRRIQLMTDRIKEIRMECDIVAAELHLLSRIPMTDSSMQGFKMDELNRLRRHLIFE